MGIQLFLAMKFFLALALCAVSSAFVPSTFNTHAGVSRQQGRSVRMGATFTKAPASVKPGVVSGQALVDLLEFAKDNEFAIPGVNVVSSSSINACMEAASKYGGPVMVTSPRVEANSWPAKGPTTTMMLQALLAAL